MLSKKTKREKNNEKPIFFLEKLFKILKNKKNWEIINWNEDGTNVIIFDPIKFTNKILPKYFKHKNYSSFVRQLNIYGFEKINNIYNSKIDQYFNNFFQKNKTEEEIRNIKRTNVPNVYINEEILDENKKKEDKNLLNEFDKEDDNKKIVEFKNLFKNEKRSNKLSKNILEFLIKKSNERMEFYQKINKEIQKIKNNNEIISQYIKGLNNNLNLDKENYNIDILINNNSNNNEKYNYENNSMVTNESFTLIGNEKLFHKLIHISIIKPKPKVIDNPDNSIIKEINKIFGNSKNNNQIPVNLNSTLLINTQNVNNNDNNSTILKDSITIFM